MYSNNHSSSRFSINISRSTYRDFNPGTHRRTYMRGHLSPGNTEGLGLLTRQAHKILAKPAIIIPSLIPTISDFTTAAWIQALNNRTASITVYGLSELVACQRIETLEFVSW